MLRWSVLIAAILCLVHVASCTPPLVAKVDTRIGSGGRGFGVGSINPGAQVPFGAMRLGPDSDFLGLDLKWQHYGGYFYGDNDIVAFSHTHLVGAGVGDWGNVGVMPVRTLSNTEITKNTYRSSFSHKTEVAQPGTYQVELETPNVGAAVTVSGTLSGIHRYTFHATAAKSDAWVLIDVCHTISEGACANASVSATLTDDGVVVSGSVLNKGSLTGRSPQGGVWVHFYAIIPSALSYQLWTDKELQAVGGPALSTTSGSLGAAVKVDTAVPDSSGDVVALVRMGISFINVKNAELNLAAQQAPSGSYLTFSDALTQAQSEWEAMLSRVEVTASAESEEQVTKFYGALYRAFLAPTKYTEVDSQYLGFDNQVHTWGSIGDYHSDMSLWDIFRSQIPLLNLLAPEVGRDTVRSMLTMFSEGGHLPRWPLANVYTGCMVGSHGIVGIADALVKGIKGINATLALAAAYAAANGQDNSDSYKALGYVPVSEDGQGASLTLDYALDDWATSQIAEVVNASDTHEIMLNRSKNYRNVWDAQEMFFCPKTKAGVLQCPEVATLPYPLATHYTEGNAWQYQFFVPGDPEGLVDLFPSVDEYVTRLNTFFNKSLAWPLGNFMPNPYYWAGNEPDILSAWQFNFAGNAHAHLTQYWTRKMVEHEYSLEASGLPGNDDFGTMSAWEAWAYLGLYPLTGSTRFSIGAPAFSSVTVTLPSVSWEAMGDMHPGSPSSAGVALTILAHNASPEAVYVANATANGVPLPTPFVTQEQLMNGGAGGKLEFWMSTEPSEWGASQ